MPTSKFSYFKNFPKVTYRNESVTNIMVRTKVLDSLKNQVNVFLPYTIDSDETPEHVAYNYYDDVELDWIVLLSNEILDPYFQWPLGYIDFVRFIEKKYGSVVAAKASIHEYRNSLDPSIIISPGSISFQQVPGDWDAITDYEYEDEANENRRNIFLIDKRYTTVVVNNLNELLV